MSEQTKFNDDAEDATTKTVDAPAKKATKAKKPAAKKAPAKKKAAAKKSTAKKSDTAKGAAKTTAKKAPAKKTAKKTPAKKAPAKKTTKAKTSKKKAKSDKPGKTLVIVESPAKAKTINKYLGDNYIVKASMGHVRDLPRNDVGISIEDKFTPTYEVLADKEKIVSDLKKSLKKVDRIAYACDPDREGEAIAWHLSEILASKKPAIRVTFNEITKQAIEKAFESPSQIDMNKVNAQQARRLLDRLVGYKLSPLLWRKVRRGLSAGRVQSVAVKIIVNRERLIQAFRAHEYWRLSAEFKDSVAEDAIKFFADLHSLGGSKLDPKGFHIENETRATLVRDRLVAGTAQVSRADVKEKADRPYPPFITSTLQQAASTKLRYTTKKTMMIAQQLYEGIDLGGDIGHLGLITYMRTDSFNLAQESIDAVREYITDKLGAEYLPDKPQVYKTKKKSAQEAHEAIRPTRPDLSPESIKQHLKDDQFKLYQLIWQRFVGCQMKPARYAHKTIEVTITPSDKLPLASPAEGELQNDERFDGPAVFRITGKTLVFHGHALVTGVKVKENEPLLPELPKGKTVQLSKLQESQHFTQPPPRYTEASLVKTLEEFGIGRPSTYSAITQTIQDRKYVTQESRKLYATKLGEIVTDKLGAHFGDIMNTEFTSQMEQNLDSVEDASGDWVALLSDFYSPFKENLKQAKQNMKALNEDPPKADVKCDQCDSDMVYKYNKRDLSRFLGCVNYPKCRNTLALDEEDRPQIPEETDKVCTECGSSMVIRNGKNGKFMACSAYPKCKTTHEIDSEGKVTKAPEFDQEVECHECKKPMQLKRGPFGYFLGCSSYPKCRGKRNVEISEDNKAIPKEPSENEGPVIDKKCSKCNAPMKLRRFRRRAFLGCSAYPKCRETASLPKDFKLPPPPEPKKIGEECPDCSKPLVLRTGRRGHFVGCSGYPECAFTRQKVNN